MLGRARWAPRWLHNEDVVGASPGGLRNADSPPPVTLLFWMRTLEQQESASGRR